MSYNGSWYQSTKEGRYARLLDTLKNASNPAERVVKWEKQVKVPLSAHGKHICNMYVDFHVWYASGREEYHEVKSPITITPTYKLKEKLFRAEYPERVFVIVMDVR